MSGIPFGPGGLAFVGSYLGIVLILGYVSRRQRRSESLSDFYLAGKNLGGLVLLLTIYATQYSGNTLLGYPGEAYRLGFPWVMSVGFMMSIIVVYLLFAPRLYEISRKHDFVTPGDWIQYRFDSTALTVLANILMVLAIANFLLAQLIAMGHVVSGLTGGLIPYWLGVLFLALIIIVYETMGGMRAVAWTDCMQGLMLLIGLVGLLIAALPSVDSLRSATEWIANNQPEKSSVPSWSIIRTWISTLLLVGFSGAVYPQAIQRIYSARDRQALKRSLSIMAFMPLFSTAVVFLIGILSIQKFVGLSDKAADQVMPMMLQQWAGESTLLYALVVVVVTAMLAAIMSTADSVLLSLSSILAKDFLGKTVMRAAKEERLTRAGKKLSWVVMAILVAIAITPRITLWGLTELKMELLAQVAPVIILGVWWKPLSARAALAGMVSGATISVSLALGGLGKIWGLHAGVLGLALNLGLCLWLSRRPDAIHKLKSRALASR